MMLNNSHRDFKRYVVQNVRIHVGKNVIFHKTLVNAGPPSPKSQIPRPTVFTYF